VIILAVLNIIDRTGKQVKASQPKCIDAHYVWLWWQQVEG